MDDNKFLLILRKQKLHSALIFTVAFLMLDNGRAEILFEPRVF